MGQRSLVALAMARKAKKGRPDLAVGYLRVSTEDQNLGPAAQLQQIQRWCEQHRVELVEVFEETISGGLPLDKRPQLIAATGALGELGAGVLLVARRDRLARDTLTSAMVERLVERAGATICSADGVGNGDGPEDLLLKRMIDAFAEYERALIRTRTKAALAVKKRRGERAGQVPYGYRVGADMRRLEPLEAEQGIIDRVKQLRASGETLEAITALLNKEGVPARGKQWHLTSVVRILKRNAA